MNKKQVKLKTKKISIDLDEETLKRVDRIQQSLQGNRSYTIRRLIYKGLEAIDKQS